MSYLSPAMQRFQIRSMLRVRSYWLYRVRTNEWEKTKLNERRKHISRHRDRVEHATFSLIYDLVADRASL